ncbi:serine/threonine-protein kinase [Skeletonema marinoi]|uniref:Serine/threonine-protein kinase n=1 Tax=Skeletonema marinoi TaxID=267567 RepID=A0AAD8XRN8_9STRA|nr:serine/threonine-protein kinase [Skeletonema marinoi]
MNVLPEATKQIDDVNKANTKLIVVVDEIGNVDEFSQAVLLCTYAASIGDITKNASSSSSSSSNSQLINPASSFSLTNVLSMMKNRKAVNAETQQLELRQKELKAKKEVVKASEENLIAELNKQMNVLTESFKIHSMIYSGKFGAAVYQVTKKDEQEQGRKLVAKIVKKGTLGECEYNEVFALSRLSKHDNIVQFHYSLEDLSHRFLILEFVEGGTLLDFVETREKKTLSLELCLFLMKDLASGMAHMFGEGFSHRDIKPGNLLMKGNLPSELLQCNLPKQTQENGVHSRDFVLKLADFGFATSREKCNTMCGTEQYMAPEVFEARVTSYDPKKADLWSAGAVMLSLIHGGKVLQLLLSSNQIEFDQILIKSTSLLKNPNERDMEIFLKVFDGMRSQTHGVL